MAQTFFIIHTIALLVTIAYSCYLLWLRHNWRSSLAVENFDFFSQTKKISIVVAFRNETANLENLINSFSKLIYQKENFEILLVDDNSTDGSYIFAKELKEKYKLENLVIIKLDKHLQGKKQALKAGITLAKHYLIATTDADCVVQPNWLNQISTSFENQASKFLSMPVFLTSNNSHVQKFQQTDFLFTNAIAGASMMAKHPLMCNGANLAFYKQDFLDFQSDASNTQSSSGDDMFLMMYIYNKYAPAQSCYFNANSTSLIQSQPQSTFVELIQQRKRWVRKIRFFSNSYILGIGALISMLHTMVFIVSVALFFQHSLIFTLGLILLLKFFSEYMLYVKVNSVYKLKLNTITVFITSILYSYFVLLVTIYSVFGNYTWKGRSSKY